jgi:hypothetical protein
MSTELTKNAGAITHGFGQTEMATQGETSASALAAREQAAVQARFIVAIQRPRNIEQFRVKLLRECARPGFAEVAEYARPVGKEKGRDGNWREKIATGPSIRLIETAASFYGNLDIKSQIVYETADLRIVQCHVLDLESNSCWDKQISIWKQIEKRGFDGKPPKGRTIVGQRVNSEGEITFLVLATEDEMMVRQAALESKIQRKNAERLLPSGIIHEALAACRATLAAKDKEDPAAAVRKIIDAFAGLGIQPEDLEVWCAKSLDRLQPKDIVELRAFFVGIKEGEVTFEESMAAKDAAGSKEAAADVATKKLADLRKKVEAPPPAEQTQTEQPVASEQAPRRGLKL